VPVVVAILAVIYSLTLPFTYTAAAKILPPQGQSVTSAMAAQLGGLASLAPRAVGMRDPNELYVAMLKSRTVADNLIQRFELNKSGNAKYPSQVRARLAGITNIISGKFDGLITIEVEDGDPKRAAELANAYVDELHKLTMVLALTEASQRRLFFERQFAQARDNLADAEAAARQSLQKGGLVQVEGQSRSMIENTARLRGQITAKEVQIGAMRTFATANNPDMRAAQNELEALKQELAKLEGASSAKVADDNAGSSRGMDSVRQLRNVKYYETLYDLLGKQYELAKLDESKDSGIVQVLDAAIEPDSRSGPKRTQIVLLSTMVAGLLAVLWVFMRELVSRSRQNSEQSVKLQLFRRHLAAK
jgi:tyrosine-protein kinase Etk/Wzc